MKTLYAIMLVLLCSMSMKAQTFLTRNGHISFYSRTPLEDIRAENRQVYAAIDLSKKTIAFTLLLRNFLFDKQLMQDHFNENYVESDRYPKAQFTGAITGNTGTDAGVYKVEVQGRLTLHGVTQPLTLPAELEVQDGKLTGRANFSVVPADYNIKIPAVVRDKIAPRINVQVIAECSPLK